MLTYSTAGESHGKSLLAMVDGFPAGLQIDEAFINNELRLRQGGYGRGGRQKLEQDQVNILSGVWQGVTLGSPIAMQIVNNDYKLERLKELERPRPGHADLTGAIKYLGSIRGVLERSSARETAARVAAGALARLLLREFGIETVGYVVELGQMQFGAQGTEALSIAEVRVRRDQSSLYSVQPHTDPDAQAYIDRMADQGDTLGGIVEVRVDGLPFGLGTHAQWNRKLDGRLAQAVMAVQAIKGVEIGMGFEAARKQGSEVHDPIHHDASLSHLPHLGYIRPSNNAGGLEGGMTNGQSLILRAAKKPISTLRKPLDSIRMEDKQPHRANYERSDVCAISAAAIIVEHVVAFEIATALVDKFGGDSLVEMKARYELFMKMAREH
jgi:chorismate synthase